MSTTMTGKELAASIRAEVAERAAALTAAGTAPRLVVVTATADEASAWYVRSIARAAGKVGIHCDVVDLLHGTGHGGAGGGAGSGAGDSADGGGMDAGRIADELARVGADPLVHGVMLQTPLPAGGRLEELAAAIPAGKDVDGANPLSLGRLAAGLPAFAPATAAAVLALLDHHGVDLAGRRAVVVGRSTVVGKPLAHLLLDRHATVTVCHSRTRDLASVTRQADVLVAAVGRPRLITADHVAPGAVVVDVGTNPTEDGGLVGDVDADAVAGTVGALTPVPGGVGPVTTALLLRHTVEAASG